MFQIVRLLSSQRPRYTQHLLTLQPEQRADHPREALSDVELTEHVERIDFTRDLLFAATSNLALAAAVHVAVGNDRDGIPFAQLRVTSTSRCCTAMLRALIEHSLSACVAEGIVRVVVATRNDQTVSSVLRALNFIEHGDEQLQHTLAENARCRVATRTVENGLEVFRAGHGQWLSAWLFHGAGGNAWQWRSHVMPALVAAGYKVEAISMHTGDGSAPCALSNAEDQARAAHRTLQERAPNLIIGHCLGAITAARLASIVEPDFLVLANPMPADGMSEIDRMMSTSALDCVRSVAILARGGDYLPSPKLRGRILITSGDADRVSPLYYGTRTAKYHAAAQVERCVLTGDHLNIKTPAFVQTVLASSRKRSTSGRRLA